MIIKTMPLGQLEANCYLLADERTNRAVLVDPGDEPDRVLEMASGFDVQYVVLTHAHFDHAAASGDIKEATGAEIALHADDLEIYRAAPEHAAFWGFKMDPLPEPDLLLGDGDEILLGELSLLVIHTPGHSPGCICIYAEGVLLSGDTLFAGSVGRTDLPGGDLNLMGASFRRLMDLPGDTTVLPGHGPSTTIGHERRHNAFAEEFLGE